jgi:hypothetical protein
MARFSYYLDRFDESRLFTGPSLYFHLRTLQIRRQHIECVGQIESCLDSEAFFESLYATLTAWGLHRMGNTNTKLAELPEIVDSFERNRANIRQLEKLELGKLTAAQLPGTQSRVWSLIEDLRIGIGKAKLVAGSKALHHVLPQLVPPIDRHYTITFFFFGPNAIQGRGNEKEAFDLMYPVYNEVLQSCAAEIAGRLNCRPWNTSSTKLVDNAIVGYMLSQRATDETSCIDAYFQDEPFDEKRLRRAARRLAQDPILKTLSPAEERVLLARLGIGHDQRSTAGDLAVAFNCSEQMVREMEAKALRKLRHPSRTHGLRAFLDEKTTK